VGKSLAYLLPSAIFATANSTPVVVSTNTINLQEQLLTKDVPTLRKALETAGGALQDVARFRVALLKGRSNYLCQRRWQLFHQGQPATASEARFRARLLIWLSQGASGDLGDLNLPPDELPFWSRVSALADDCSPANCPHVRGSQCFLFAARDRAKAAHIVLVNHALLLSDLARDGMVLPEHQHVVVDEAHHLEEEATHQWGLQLGEEDLVRFLSNLLGEASGGKRSGLLALVGARLRSRPAAVRTEALQVVERMESAVQEARRLARDLFHLLSPLARESQGPNSDERRLRLTPQVLGSSSWAALVRTQEALTRPWMELEEGLGKLYILLGQGEDLADEAASRRLEAQNLRQQLTDLTGEASEDVVRWASIEGQGRDRLCSAPLHVGELLNDRLLSIKETVVLTSATLTTEGTFEHLKDRLGLTPKSEVLLGSPYDYKGSTLLWVAQDMPEPGHRQYQAGLERTLVQLLAATEGRALVLFTSHSALRAVLNGIRGPLEKRGLLVLGQGVDGSRNQLLDMFKSHQGSVLLGTSSFWEGVDVVGDSLSVVVITRLPFHVPSDPVFAARSQAFEDGFNQYALPLSILRFRQGFGRLIRSHSDRGVMAILDSRLHRKAYGRAFLKSLPKCTVRVGPASDLPGAAADWLCSSQAALI
ncbi:MAG: helicase C-terminal domain-containing protein, partial [Dehalococcoidia bacterium]|nr:helicase C-terminal domain-containing protein [Dehalococcoidia bacterium]